LKTNKVKRKTVCLEVTCQPDETEMFSARHGVQLLTFTDTLIWQ